MSRREIFAAFVYSKIVENPEYRFDLDLPAWVRDRMARAGLALTVHDQAGPAQGLDRLPLMTSELLGLPVVVRGRDERDTYRALILVLGRTGFFRAADEEFERRFATCFRDICDALDPDYAFLNPVPVENIPEFLLDVDMELSGLDVAELLGFGFPLWYAAGSLSRNLPESRLTGPSAELPSEHGVVMLAGGAPTGWLSGAAPEPGHRAPEAAGGPRRTVPDEQVRQLAAALAALRPSWSAADAPRVAEQLGWSVASGAGTGGLVARTGLAPFDGLADLRCSGAVLNQIVVRLSDGEKEPTPGFDDYRSTVFARAARTVTGELGEPSERRPGRSPQIRWSVPGGQLRLSDGGVFVELSLSSDRFAAILDAEVADDDITEDWPGELA